MTTIEKITVPIGSIFVGAVLLPLLIDGAVKTDIALSMLFGSVMTIWILRYELSAQ